LRREIGKKTENVDELILLVEKRITITRKKIEENTEIAEGVEWAIMDDEKAQEGEDGK